MASLVTGSMNRTPTSGIVRVDAPLRARLRHRLERTATREGALI